MARNRGKLRGDGMEAQILDLGGCMAVHESCQGAATGRQLRRIVRLTKLTIGLGINR